MSATTLRKAVINGELWLEMQITSGPMAGAKYYACKHHNSTPTKPATFDANVMSTIPALHTATASLTCGQNSTPLCEIDTGSSAVPGNFFDEKNAMISCFHVSSILGLGPGTPDHARTMVSYKFRLSPDYYPANLARIKEKGAKSVFQGWMRTLFQRDRIVDWMTPKFGDTFYAPADSMTGVFHVDLSEDIGLNARLDGVSMNCECVVNVDTKISGTLNSTQKQMIEAKMMSMMAVWRAKRSICYMPRASTKVLRFDFNEQKWLAILRCLCDWAKTAYDPANPNHK